MKKRFLTIAIAAGMAASFAASAGDATVFGNIHVSWDDKDDDTAGQPAPTFNSNTSTIGVKGKEDMGGGMTALYFLEWQVDVINRNDGDGAGGDTTSLTDRDQWVGIKKAGMGTLKIGTVTSNYKKTGSKVDPMWRTQLEARASGAISNLHNGAGIERGRLTNAYQLSSAPIAGVQVVINGTVTDSTTDPETLGIGIRYKTKKLLAFIDTISVDDGTATGNDETATKIGAAYKIGDVKVAGQYEDAEDLKGVNYLFLAGTYNLSKSDSVSVTFASNDGKTLADNDGSGYALMYNHNMSKRTNVYAGYGSEDFNDDDDDNTTLTLGLRHKF